MVLLWHHIQSGWSNHLSFQSAKVGENCLSIILYCFIESIQGICSDCRIGLFCYWYWHTDENDDGNWCDWPNKAIYMIWFIYHLYTVQFHSIFNFHLPFTKYAFEWNAMDVVLKWRDKINVRSSINQIVDTVRLEVGLTKSV